MLMENRGIHYLSVNSEIKCRRDKIPLTGADIKLSRNLPTPVRRFTGNLISCGSIIRLACERCQARETRCHAL